MRRTYLLVTAEEEATRGATSSERPFERLPEGGIEAAHRNVIRKGKNRKGVRGETRGQTRVARNDAKRRRSWNNTLKGPGDGWQGHKIYS